MRDDATLRDDERMRDDLGDPPLRDDERRRLRRHRDGGDVR